MHQNMDLDTYCPMAQQVFFLMIQQKLYCTQNQRNSIIKYKQQISYFEYMERKQNDKQDIIAQYTFAEYPKELKKKVTLLQHFKNYLEGEKFEPIQSSADINNKSQPLGMFFILMMTMKFI